MFLGGLAVVALLSSALSHHLGTSYKHRHDDRSVDPGCTCEDSSTRSSIAPSSSDTGTVTTTLAPTPTTTVNDATKSTPSASTTASDDTMSPTKTTGTSVSSTGYASALCSSSPITGCAKSRYIIAQSSLSSGNNCFSQCFQNSICTGYMVGKDTDGHYRCDLLKTPGEMILDQDLTESNPNLCNRYLIYDFRCVDPHYYP